MAVKLTTTVCQKQLQFGLLFRRSQVVFVCIHTSLRYFPLNFPLATLWVDDVSTISSHVQIAFDSLRFAGGTEH